jgi:hypothetical protein
MLWPARPLEQNSVSGDEGTVTRQFFASCSRKSVVLSHPDYATLVVPPPISKCVRKIEKTDYELRYVRPTVSLCTWKNSALTGRIFMKFVI